MWVGAITSTTARIVVSTTNSVRLAVDVESSLAGATFYGPVTPANGVASFTVTGLDPNTRYFYAVEDGWVSGPVGSFKTTPLIGEPSSFQFTAGNCAGHAEGGFTLDQVSNHPVFDTIRSVDPLLNIHLGDLHYRDITTNDPASFRSAYTDALATRQGVLLREVPTAYMIDDHDAAGNNSHAGSTAMPSALQVYREQVPHYPLPDATGLWQSWAVGRVLFLLADVRSYRSPNSDPDGSSKTMLGSAQKAWMEVILADPGFDAAMLVWLMPSQWMGTGSDTWASFATERAELVGLFGDYQWLDRMCIVGGDLHALAIDTGTGNTSGGFPVFQVGSYDGNGGLPTLQYDTGPTSPGRNRFGRFDVHDCGAGVTLTGNLHIGTSTWKAHTLKVARVGSPALPATVSFQQPINEDGFTDTSYAPGANACAVVFTAPPSGRVTVTWAARMETNTGDGVLVSVEVRSGDTVGSGGVVAAADDDYAVETAGVASGNDQKSNFRLVSGLTPGAKYHARTMHKVTAGNADLFSRQVLVRPEP